MSPHPHSKETWEMLDAIISRSIAKMRLDPLLDEVVVMEVGSRGVVIGDTLHETPQHGVLEVVLRKKAAG